MSATASISALCNACQAPLTGSPLFCASCGAVQPAFSEPAAIDYFRVFALPRQLALDAIALGGEFHRLSRRLHPDRFARAGAEQQAWSLAATALLNDAWRTLRDPLQRLEYLLNLEGYQLGEEHAGKSRSADRQPPADLLEEVFDLNMQLEELRMSRKTGDASDPALVSDLTAARARFDGLLASVDADIHAQSELWDAGIDAGRAQAAAALLALLDRRRYLRNLVRDVSEALNPA